MSKLATKVRNDARRNGKAWAKRTGNTPPKTDTEKETKVRQIVYRDKPGSNLTYPKVDWNWFTLGLRTAWRFEGQGSRKLRTMDSIISGTLKDEVDKAKKDELVKESTSVRTPKKKTKGGS